MSAVSFRFRYLIGVLCHVALALVACSELPQASASTADILASCGASPSFVDATALKRWTSFPVDVYVDLSSFPESRRRAYRDGVELGVSLWAEATRGGIGVFRVNYNRPDSPVTIAMADGALPDNALGSTELTFTSSRIVSGRVRLSRSLLEETPFLVNDVASTTAHEMGHVLGIVDHSPFPEDKMWVSGNFRPHNQDRNPLELVTARDINTLRGAYCQP